MTPTSHGILVAVDLSEAADRALRYVAEVTAGRPGFRIRLLHLLPPTPSALLEHGGSEDPAQEIELERGLRAARRDWIDKATEEAQPLFERARTILAAGGFDGEIETECRASVDAVAVARDCREAAAASGCRTIALGRNSLPWLRELFHVHAGEALVKNAGDLAVWVVP